MGSYIRRLASTPSAGKTDILVSGGVLTGVMVSETLLGAFDAAPREEAVAFIVSYEWRAERGLGSLPGGDESELVKGVRACRDTGGPERDMAVDVREVEGAGVGVTEMTQFSSVSERSASLRGEYELVVAVVLRASPAATAVGPGCELTDEPASCEPARRDEPSRRMPRRPLAHALNAAALVSTFGRCGARVYLISAGSAKSSGSHHCIWLGLGGCWRQMRCVVWTRLLLRARNESGNNARHALGRRVRCLRRVQRGSGGTGWNRWNMRAGRRCRHAQRGPGGRRWLPGCGGMQGEVGALVPRVLVKRGGA
jgi:hypothetical protein